MKPNGWPDLTGEAVYESALTYLGSPFHWGGSVKAGIDCGGLYKAALRDLGVPIPQYRPVGRGDVLGYIVECAGVLAREVSEWQTGDLLVFYRPALGCFGHCGIYHESGSVVNVRSEKPDDYVVEETRTRFWLSSVKHAFRYLGTP